MPAGRARREAPMTRARGAGARALASSVPSAASGSAGPSPPWTSPRSPPDPGPPLSPGPPPDRSLPPDPSPPLSPGPTPVSSPRPSPGPYRSPRPKRRPGQPRPHGPPRPRGPARPRGPRYRTRPPLPHPLAHAPAPRSRPSRCSRPCPGPGRQARAARSPPRRRRRIWRPSHPCRPGLKNPRPLSNRRWMSRYRPPPMRTPGLRRRSRRSRRFRLPLPSRYSRRPPGR